MKLDKWTDLEKSLERLQPFYGLMNKVMSLGNEKIVRKQSLEYVKNSENYLDAGTGPGTMASLVKNRANIKKTFLLDPSIDLLKINNIEGEKINAKFENIPFKDNTFDLITCGFSFRDAISHEKAAEELSRVLNKNGNLIIVDIGKPDIKILQFFYYIYIFLFPLLASLIITKGKMIHEYYTLFFTYVEYPSHSKIIQMFEKNNLKLIAQGKRFGGAIFFDVYTKK